jgi:hypothetical protein
MKPVFIHFILKYWSYRNNLALVLFLIKVLGFLNDVESSLIQYLLTIPYLGLQNFINPFSNLTQLEQKSSLL